jgi:uncharacterized protein YlaI
MIEDKIHVPSFTFGIPGFCTYCGGKSNSIDHVIPVSSYRMKTMMKRRGAADAGIRTYACSKCNSRLGAKTFKTFRQRIEFVISKITKDASEFKRDASWSDEEIAELDHTLRTYIANRQFRMREADEKTIWIHTIQFSKVMSTLESVHCINKDHPKFTKWVFDYFRDYTHQKP